MDQQDEKCVPSVEAIEKILTVMQAQGVKQSAEAIVKVTGGKVADAYATLVRDQCK